MHGLASSAPPWRILRAIKELRAKETPKAAKVHGGAAPAWARRSLLGDIRGLQATYVLSFPATKSGAIREISVERL